MQIEEAPPAATTREDSLLTAMRNLPGVTGVSTAVIGNGTKANDHGDKWRQRQPLPVHHRHRHQADATARHRGRAR